MSGPARGVLATISALDRMVRIGTGVHPNFQRSDRPPSAAPRVHRGEWLRIVSEGQTLRGSHGLSRITGGIRRLAHELAMRGVAEIELGVPPSARNKIRTRGNGLGLESFNRGIREVLRRDDRR